MVGGNAVDIRLPYYLSLEEGGILNTTEMKTKHAECLQALETDVGVYAFAISAVCPSALIRQLCNRS